MCSLETINGLLESVCHRISMLNGDQSRGSRHRQTGEIAAECDVDVSERDVEGSARIFCELIGRFFALRDQARFDDLAKASQQIQESFEDCDACWGLFIETGFASQLAQAFLEQNSADAEILFQLVVFFARFKRKEFIEEIVTRNVVGCVLELMFKGSDLGLIVDCMEIITACCVMDPVSVERVVSGENLVDFGQDVLGRFTGDEGTAVTAVAAMILAICSRFSSNVPVEKLEGIIHTMLAQCPPDDALCSIFQTITLVIQKDDSLLALLSSNGTWELVREINQGETLLVVFRDLSSMVRVANAILNKQMKAYWDNDEARERIEATQHDICTLYSLSDLVELIKVFIDKSPKMITAVITLATSIINSSPELIQTPSVVVLLKASLRCWDECFELKQASLNFVITVIRYGTPDNARLLREIGFIQAIISAMSWDAEEKILKKVFEAIHSYLQKFAYSIELPGEKERLIEFGIETELQQVLDSDVPQYIKERASHLLNSITSEEPE